MCFDSTQDSSKKHLILIWFTIQIRVVWKSAIKHTIFCNDWGLVASYGFPVDDVMNIIILNDQKSPNSFQLEREPSSTCLLLDIAYRCHCLGTFPRCSCSHPVCRTRRERAGRCGCTVSEWSSRTWRWAPTRGPRGAGRRRAAFRWPRRRRCRGRCQWRPAVAPPL